MTKPKCPRCRSKKWINSMVAFFSISWFLCSKCGWSDYDVKVKGNG